VGLVEAVESSEPNAVKTQGFYALFALKRAQRGMEEAAKLEGTPSP